MDAYYFEVLLHFHPFWRPKRGNLLVYPKVNNRKQDKGSHQYWG